MTVDELNREFDLLYNNVMSDMAPGLDGYEKSVFLTLAQEEVVKGLYTGSLGEGFESSEMNRRYLANLIRQEVIASSDSGFPTAANGNLKVVNNYNWYVFELESDLMVLLAEQAIVTGIGCCNDTEATKMLNVQPVKYDELNKLMDNPFRKPNRNQVLRADVTSQEVVIVSSYELTQYSYEYLKKPAPIIVEDLSGYTDSLGTALSVNGETVKSSEVELDSSLHRIILKHAVQLAAASWASNNKN